MWVCVKGHLKMWAFVINGIWGTRLGISKAPKPLWLWMMIWKMGRTPGIRKNVAPNVKEKIQMWFLWEWRLNFLWQFTASLDYHSLYGSSFTLKSSGKLWYEPAACVMSNVRLTSVLLLYPPICCVSILLFVSFKCMLYVCLAFIFFWYRSISK